MSENMLRFGNLEMEKRRFNYFKEPINRTISTVLPNMSTYMTCFEEPTYISFLVKDEDRHCF